MLMCVFCGALNPPSYKQLEAGYVRRLLQKQRDAGVSEPVLNLMFNLLESEAEGEPGEPGEAQSEPGEAPASSCMCCFYWVERRRSAPVVPLPMQNLLWFVRNLRWCEGGKSDSRILQRLVETVAVPGNTFAQLFEDSEMRGLRRIAGELAAQRSGLPFGPAKDQSRQRYSVKRALASLWREMNANPLCLPHGAAADLLRQTARVDDVLP